MIDPFAKVCRYIADHRMVSGARGVLVAVSGGPDSITLLDILVRLRDLLADEGKDRVPLWVAHLNHRLRGRESDQDAEFVRDVSERLRLPISIDTADVRQVATGLGVGIEQAARQLRYRFLLDSARGAGLDRIAVGHTMDDQAETFLMRLARGAGPRGLAAMRPVATVPVCEFGAGLGPARGDGKITAEVVSPFLIRPLLCITRDEVEAYSHQRRLEYRVDHSNLELDYTRNRVRLTVLPALRAVNPRIVGAIARAAEDIGEEQDALDQVAKSLLAATGPSVQPELWRTPRLAFSVAEFCLQPSGLRRRMLIEAIRCAGRTAAEPEWEITRSHVLAVESLLEDGTSGRRVQLPAGLEVWREFDDLTFTWAFRPSKEARVDQGGGEDSKTGYSYELSPERARVDAGGVALAMQRGVPRTELPLLLLEARRAREEGLRNWLFAALDEDTVPAALVVRPRRPGQCGVVLRHRQTIKLKKLMIDHKIPASRRAFWPVVTTPDGRYIWSPGLPPAVDFAARDETRALTVVRALNL